MKLTIKKTINNILLASTLSLAGISNGYTQVNKPQEIFPLEKTLAITPSEYMYNIGKEPKNLKDYKLVNVNGEPNCSFYKSKLPQGVDAIVMTKEIYGSKIIPSTSRYYYTTNNGNKGSSRFYVDLELSSTIVTLCKGTALIYNGKKEKK